MKLNATIKFEEKYLPTKRHRIPRTREVEESVEVELREIRKSDAPVAMVVTDYKSYLDTDGINQYGPQDVSFHVIDGQLYSEKRDQHGALDRGAYSLEQFSKDLNRSGNCHFAWNASKRSREDMLRSLQDFLDSHVMIDGVVYQQVSEPRYVVMTFGLGHNHGGTAMMITQHYNPNISKDRYFSALERDKAIAYANKVAEGRGDTKDIGKFGRDCNIQVLMPETVRCEPQREHGDGDSFINSLENLITASDSAAEAGILVMAETLAETRAKKTPESLSNRIQDANDRAVSSVVEENLHSNKDKGIRSRG